MQTAEGTHPTGPITPPDDTDARAEDHVARSDARPMTVRLVDDDRGISRALSMYLGRRGVRVEQDQTGGALLAHFEPDPRVCVVVDVRLPDMTGYEMLDRLAAMGHEPPAVVITGHGPPASGLQVRRRDVECVLLKPFEPDALLNVVRHAIDGPDAPSA